MRNAALVTARAAALRKLDPADGCCCGTTAHV
jgi:hypothetical protein